MFLRKRKITLLIAVIAAVALAGGAYAATQSTTSGPQAFLNDVAKRLGVSPARLKTAVQGAYFDRLSAAVAAGRLTKAQASAIEQKLKKSGAMPFGLGFAFGAAVPGNFAAPFFRKGAPPSIHGLAKGRLFAVPAPFMRPGRFGGPAGFGLGLLLGPGGGIHAALRYLGVRPAQLMAQLRSGKSLADIARAHGKTAAGLTAVLLTAQKARLDKLVAAKRLSSAQEAKIMAAMRAMTEARVNAASPRFFHGAMVPPALFYKHGRAFKHGGEWKAYSGPGAPPPNMPKSAKPSARGATQVLPAPASQGV